MFLYRNTRNFPKYSHALPIKHKNTTSAISSQRAIEFRSVEKPTSKFSYSQK